ncbi:MAG: DUF481 domain-containing protein [Rhodospirillaceae bacterium]|nr:DUF481 domain-containing protein [Rhodospirillaceae bacterium]
MVAVPGARAATGNTDRQALDLETKVKRRAENREDRFKLLSNLARENKETSAERFQAAAQTNYDISKDKFLCWIEDKMSESTRLANETLVTGDTSHDFLTNFFNTRFSEQIETVDTDTLLTAWPNMAR